MKRHLRRSFVGWLQRQPRDRLMSLISDIGPTAGLETVLARGRNGDVFIPLADPVIARSYLNRGVWSEGIVDVLVEALHDGGTLIDIGANVGLTSIPLARVDGVQVIAFEPHPDNLRHLRASIAWNDLSDRVDVHALALADEAGTMPLEISPVNMGDHRLRSAPDPATGALFDEDTRDVINVPVNRLDDVIDRNSLTRPLVVKLDVQGAEALVIDGGRWVIGAADLLVLEFWPYGLRRHGSDPTGLIAELAGMFSELAIINHQPVDFQPIVHGSNQLMAAPAENSSASWHVDIALRGKPSA